jgi:hypothetical protein
MRFMTAWLLGSILFAPLYSQDKADWTVKGVQLKASSSNSALEFLLLGKHFGLGTSIPLGTQDQDAFGVITRPFSDVSLKPLFSSDRLSLDDQSLWHFEIGTPISTKRFTWSDVDGGSAQSTTKVNYGMEATLKWAYLPKNGKAWFPAEAHIKFQRLFKWTAADSLGIIVTPSTGPSFVQNRTLTGPSYGAISSASIRGDIKPSEGFGVGVGYNQVWESGVNSSRPELWFYWYPEGVVPANTRVGMALYRNHSSSGRSEYGIQVSLDIAHEWWN